MSKKTKKQMLGMAIGSSLVIVGLGVTIAVMRKRYLNVVDELECMKTAAKELNHNYGQHITEFMMENKDTEFVQKLLKQLNA